MKAHISLLDNQPLDPPLPRNGPIRWGMTFYPDDGHAPFCVVVPGEIREGVPWFDGYILTKDIINQVAFEPLET